MEGVRFALLRWLLRKGDELEEEGKEDWERSREKDRRATEEEGVVEAAMREGVHRRRERGVGRAAMVGKKAGRAREGGRCEMDSSRIELG